MKRSVLILCIIAACVCQSFGVSYEGGDGSEANPYQIATAEQFLQIEGSRDSFILLNDIDLSDHSFESYVFDSSFDGILDGNGFAVTGLNMSTAEPRSNVALFYSIYYEGVVKNLGIKDFTISTPLSSNVAALCVTNEGRIINCYAEGSINAQSSAAGLCCFNKAVIKNSYFKGDISATNAGASGFCLSNEANSVILNSYSDTNIHAEGGAVGFCNTNAGLIINSYSVSTFDVLGNAYGFCVDNLAGNILSCFWNKEAAGSITEGVGTGYSQDSFVDVTGLTTPEMAYKYTYTEAGWPVVDVEKYNGIEDWYFIDGNAPVLAWQKEVPHYTVTFVINPYSQLKRGKLVQEVPLGTSAAAPVLNSYEHIGWDVDFSNITSDLTVTAIYEDGIDKGQGTEDDPYRIYTVADLEDRFWSSGRYYKLQNDIELMGQEYNTSPIRGFYSVLDGAGYKITGLEVISKESEPASLIASNGGIIQNLGIENSTVITYSQYTEGVGALVAENSGDIKCCYAKNVYVLGEKRVGCLVGRSFSGGIIECYANGHVVGKKYIGGLCGYSESSISNSYSACIVDGYTDYKGGLVGQLERSNIEKCYSFSHIVPREMYLGYGIARTLYPAYFHDCFWLTDNNPGITEGIPEYDTTQYPNAVTGISSAEMSSKATFEENDWDFIGESYNGNLEIWYMPKEGYPLLSWQEQVPHHNVTFVAGDYGQITKYTTKCPEIKEVVQSVAEGKSATSPIIECGYYGYSWVGWDKDFSNITEDITVTALYAQVDKGDGTESNPYKIYTITDLEQVEDRTTAYYELMNDINLSGYKYDNCVISFFDGNFEGNGFELYGVVIGGNLGFGFFDYLETNAVVRNLGLNKVDVGNNYVSDLGALVGDCSGIIENCYAKNIYVRGDWRVGGLCGNIFDASIRSSYTTGRVTGYSNIGGLCGRISYSSIQDCYSTCDVESLDETLSIGGFIGDSDNISILNCYSTGVVALNYPESLDNLANAFCNDRTVEDVYSSFWLLDSNPDITDYSSGYSDLTGIYDATMSDKATFIDAGWDFVGESYNGNYNIWYMPAEGYPILSWQEEVPHYTVTFVGGEYGVIQQDLAVQSVAKGTSAQSPTVEETGDLNWIGWDKDFSNVTSDLIVNAVYSDVDKGNGTPERPYKIYTIADLEAINNDTDACYILMNNIDLSGKSYEGCIVQEFYGLFDGDGFTIKNLVIENRLGSIYSAFFAQIKESAIVKNLNIENCYSSIALAVNTFNGGLTAVNYGLISGCSFEGILDAEFALRSTAGILCCNNHGIIEKSYSKGVVIGGTAGGVVGYNYGTIKNSFTECSLLDIKLGGNFCVINSSMSYIENCYANGCGNVNGSSEYGIYAFCIYNEAIINASFWNTQTYGADDLHGVAMSDGDESGVTGIGNAQMAYPNTFSNAGWDLAGRLGDGFEEIWVVSGGEFPQLSGLEPVSFDNQDVIGMISQWLGDGDYDIYPDGGDGVVDINDWAWIAKGWANQDL